jgi:head-tail adaptor
VTRLVNLERRLVLEERRTEADGAGGFRVIWADLGVLWAEVAARTGAEVFSGGRERSRVPHRILVRGAPVGAQSRPKPGQRFREGVRIFDIISVAEADPAGRYLEVQAEEGTQL